MDVTPPLSRKPAYPLSAFIAVKILKELCQIEFLSSIHFFPSVSPLILSKIKHAHVCYLLPTPLFGSFEKSKGRRGYHDMGTQRSVVNDTDIPDGAK